MGKVEMNYLFLDFETVSEIELPKAGAHYYSGHESTRVLCVGLAKNDEPAKIYSPRRAGQIVTEFQLEGGLIVAHNLAFEKAIWINCCITNYGWPAYTEGICTMAMSYAMGLPGGLDAAAASVGIKDGKDLAGSRVMKQLCKPKGYTDLGDPIWWERSRYPDKYERLEQYCKQDVEVERMLFKRIRKLIPEEYALYLLDQKINDRGIGLDMKAAKKAYLITEVEKERLDSEMKELTEGGVRTCTAHAALLNWLLLKKTKLNGVDIDGVGKPVITALLEDSSISLEIRKVLVLRQNAAKSSTAKLKTMIDSVDADSRVRGTLQYHASHTGRWGGRRIQPQNFPRGKLTPDQIDLVFSILHS